MRFSEFGLGGRCRLGSDLRLPKVIEIGDDFGLVESTCLRINVVWAGLKFTHPKKGKTYRNRAAVDARVGRAENRATGYGPSITDESASRHSPCSQYQFTSAVA